jgi:hypothetical protein
MNDFILAIYGFFGLIVIVFIGIVIDNFISNKCELEKSIQMINHGYEQKECIGSSELKWVKTGKEDK